MEPTTQNQSLIIPVAIIAGFAMIALAIFLTSNRAEAPQVAQQPADEAALTGSSASEIRPISADDYVLGNPNAQIVMIEYSDYDCPFCKQFHVTMNQIMDEYGVTGKVAWVYRQFPLIDLHPNAPVLSEAALCVGDIGGNDAFWTFSDAVFDSRFETEPTNITRLPQFAEEAGVDILSFQECMESDRMMDDLKADMADGLVAGAQGTPYTVIKVGNQEATINGAQPYDVVKGIVANLIEQLEGTFDPETADIDGVTPS